MSESTKPVVDLLSSEAAPASADPAKYSINDDDDEDYNKLEGNYSDDDVSVEDDDQADGRISALASRTSHLINS
jgi:hypothetical protein